MNCKKCLSRLTSISGPDPSSMSEVVCSACQCPERHCTCTAPPCGNCGEHRATDIWLGEGSSLDWSHGHYEKWCRCCALDAQLEYAREMARKIYVLREQLAKVKCEVVPSPGPSSKESR